MDQSSPEDARLSGPASSATIGTPPRTSKRPFIVLAIILSLIALGCLTYWLLNRGYATTDDAQIDGDIYNIAPQIAGRVAVVDVADNQHVTAGQVLVTLDPRDQQVALAHALAEAAQQAAQAREAAADAAEAQANVTETQAALSQAQQDFDRYRRINPHAITQQTLDAATATIRSARARYAASQEQAQAMQAQISADDAALAAARSAVANAQLQLSYTVIKAPAAGHVSMKTVEPGNVVAAGAGLLALVGDQIWVTANFKETQLAGIHQGAPVTVKVDAVPGIAFKGHVDSIQYGTGAVFSLLPAQNATGNYIKIVQRVPVKILFDDPRLAHYLLAPGMSVQPAVTIQK